MATCLNIRVEKLRARINIGGVDIKTPYVKAFNIDETRGRMYKSFSATVEILATTSFVAGADIEIYDTIDGVERKRLTGIIKSITTQPSYDKAGYYILNITGVDRLGELEGRTFSRRLRSDGFSLFVSIEGGPSNRPTRGLSVDKRIRGGSHTYTSSTPKPSNPEHSTLTKMRKRGRQTPNISGRTTDVGQSDHYGSSSSGLSVHDHTTLGKGGPAFGTYSVD